MPLKDIFILISYWKTEDMYTFKSFRFFSKVMESTLVCSCIENKITDFSHSLQAVRLEPLTIYNETQANETFSYSYF